MMNSILSKATATVMCGLSLVLSVFGQCDYSKPSVATEDRICNSNPWVLEFEDNFDGDALDVEAWELQVHSQGGLEGGAGQEYNTLDNVRISDGMLHIDIKEETVMRKSVSWKEETEIMADGKPNLRNYYYTSSSLWTKNQFKYGKYEIRCRIPRGKGYWPAFWTFGGDGGWNEIDVFEFSDDYGSMGKFKPDKSVRRHNTNAHYDFDKNGGHHNCPKHKYITDFSNGMHTFTLIWTPFTIEWIVDGKSVRTKYKYKRGLKKIDCDHYQTGKKYKTDKAFPTKSMNIIVNVAVRTKNVSPGADDTSFPGVMDIDYIRYYKR